MALVTLGSQVINSTVVNNPQFLELLPEGLGDVVSSALDEGYLYGREWIASMVNKLAFFSIFLDLVYHFSS